MNNLECSSKGDKRFSAFYAELRVFNKYRSIENHYQLSKRIGDFIPETWKDVKGKTPTHIHIDGFDYDVKYTEAWYELLWVKFLDQNPELVEHANQFDTFSDMFKSKKAIVCQADTIEKYVKEGRQSILEKHKEFIRLMNQNMKKSKEE